MTRAKLADAGKWLVRRALTLGFYVGGVVAASGWDRNPNSMGLILFRLITAAMFLWWATSRTITHWHEDQEDSNG